MPTFADRLRRWYDYERDCNAKCLAMLDSVPAARRDNAAFQKTVDRLAHCIAARQRWLQRLGRAGELPPLFPQNADLAALPTQLAATEAAWVDYLATLDEAELARTVEWNGHDGALCRWEVSEILTQMFGHAWYHRGQIAATVAELGGTTLDTDYIFWSGVAAAPPRR
jgi:uncharacterized damage-inducible protein DinB